MTKQTNMSKVSSVGQVVFMHMHGRCLMCLRDDKTQKIQHGYFFTGKNVNGSFNSFSLEETWASVYIPKLNATNL